jgi:phosphoribosyl 1,2-cyclic phosphodiesterase
MGLDITILGSGSSGNATLVSDGETRVLVDVGLSGRETTRRLRECGLEPDRVSAIVISHEHGDHCRGLVPFVKSLGVPVFMTANALAASAIELEPRRVEQIRSGIPFDINGIQFTPFDVPHDAADPIAFTIERRGVKVGIVVDLGYISNLVAERLRGCDCVVLESNHDLQMLRVGPYPWALKQRVMSRRGHLSNESVARYLANEFDGRARHVVLAHLSRKNNLPEVALESARRALEERTMLLCNQTRLEMAGPDTISKTYSY